MKWIKCSDKLPEFGKCVLGLTINSECDTHVYCVTICYQGTKAIYFSCSRRIENCNPIYWMPLPNPPREIGHCWKDVNNNRWWQKRETEWHFIGISDSPIPDMEFIKDCTEECLKEPDEMD